MRLPRIFRCTPKKNYQNGFLFGGDIEYQKQIRRLENHLFLSRFIMKVVRTYSKMYNKRLEPFE